LKNIDIETFHKKIEKKITTFGGHARNSRRMLNIVKSCRLKPYSIFGDFSFNEGIDKHWIDEYNNSLVLGSNGLEVVYDDVRLKNCIITTTDLFYGRSITDTIKDSKLMLFLVGTKPAIVSYGLDEYYRSYSFNMGRWEKVSPLIIGMEMINVLIDNLSIGTIREFNPIGLHPSIECNRCILTPWPTKQDISSRLNDRIKEVIGN
jgi:hypothetical protein